MSTAAIHLLAGYFFTHVCCLIPRGELDRDGTDRLQSVVCSPIAEGTEVLRHG